MTKNDRITLNTHRRKKLQKQKEKERKKRKLQRVKSVEKKVIPEQKVSTKIEIQEKYDQEYDVKVRSLPMMEMSKMDQLLRKVKPVDDKVKEFLHYHFYERIKRVSTVDWMSRQRKKNRIGPALKFTSVS